MSNLPAAIRRVLGYVPLVLIIATGIALFDWTDFHVRGKSAFFGLNPRCIDQIGGNCFKLDTTSLSWDATAAVWLDQGIWVLTLACIVIGAGALVALSIGAAIRRFSKGKQNP